MKKRRILLHRCFFLIAIVVSIGFLFYKQFLAHSEIRVVSSIPDYSYKLESNQTKIFKKYYKDLEKELEDDRVDEENYAKLVSQLFIIDFYTLSNKVTNQDVGGVQFLHSEIQDNFKLKATDTIYRYVQSNIYGNRRQQLPTVKDVRVEEIKNVSYDYLDTTDDSAYQVQVKISYKKNLGYDTEKTLILVHEDRKLSIVEMK